MAGMLARAEEDDCVRALLRMLSRGHAVIAELQSVADCLPPAFTGDGDDAKKFADVLPDFHVFKVEGAIENVANTPELIELDAESRELHLGITKRLYRLLAAIRKYSFDVRRFLNDLDGGLYINHSLDSVVRDADGVQLVAEAIALLGAMLILVDERLPSRARERSLVAFFRFTVGTNEHDDAYSDVCQLFKSSGKPAEDDLAKRPPGYPEKYFSRFPLPREAVKMVIGQLQTGDAYGQTRHYPLPEHRSHSLASQAGLLYLTLFFDIQTLEHDVVAMREIVNRHFGDAWVVAYALGFTADLLAMWAPYSAAKQALTAAVTPNIVKHLRDQHTQKLADVRKKLEDYLTEGALTEEVVMEKTSQILNCLRQANTTIRWLLLQPTTIDETMGAIFDSGLPSKEKLLQALVDTALLEEKLRGFLGPLVARRDADWAQQKEEASQKMDDLAVYFSGGHALKRNVKNEELEQWFRGLQQRIDELEFGNQEENLALGRKVSQLDRALEEVEHFHEISSQPQILHFLSDTRTLLRRMVRTVNLKDELMDSVTIISDLSYAWKALETYQQTMQKLLGENILGAVKGLRALFLKLASVLETPLKRIRQAKNEAHESIVAEYFSERLVDFMKNVLQEIPRLIFDQLDKISQQKLAQLPLPMPKRITLVDFQEYAQRSDDAREEVGVHTKKIAMLMRGIRETEMAVLGVRKVEPRVILVEGLRHELARKIEALLSKVSFNSAGPVLTRAEFIKPIQDVANRAKVLSRSFEHVQDYVGVSSLEMWHVQFGRVVRYISHMDQHAFLRKRLPLPATSPHHCADCPIAFPDYTYIKSGAKDLFSMSFVSRTAFALMSLTDPKSTVGGLHGEWRSMDRDELLLDGLVFETLHQALGAPGLAAITKYLGLRVAGQLKRVLFKLPQDHLTPQVQSQLCEAANVARAGGSDAVRKFRGAAKSTTQLRGPLLDILTSIGQFQLLRRRIYHTLKLHASLGASLAADSLHVVDAAELMEDVGSQEEIDNELPTVLDFVGSISHDEQLARFHKQLARAGELLGGADPMRTLYVTVSEGSVPPGFDVALALALLSPSAISKPKRKSSAEGGIETVARYSDTNAALIAGFATVLQQLPRSAKDAVIQLCGAHVVEACATKSDNKDRDMKDIAESACLVEILGDLLDLLGLPRAQLAEFIPQGLLDLLPVESN